MVFDEKRNRQFVANADSGDWRSTALHGHRRRRAPKCRRRQPLHRQCGRSAGFVRLGDFTVGGQSSAGTETALHAARLRRTTGRCRSHVESFRPVSTVVLQGGLQKSTPLPNYQYIVLNRITACKQDEIYS